MQNFFDHGEDKKYQKSRFGTSKSIKFRTLLNLGGDENGEKNVTKMMAAKVFLLGYTGAGWRMQKPSKIHGLNLGHRCCFRNVVASTVDLLC